VLVGAFRLARVAIDRHFDEVAGDGGFSLVAEAAAHLEFVSLAVVCEGSVVVLGEEFTAQRRDGAQRRAGSDPAGAEAHLGCLVFLPSSPQGISGRQHGLGSAGEVFGRWEMATLDLADVRAVIAHEQGESALGEATALPPAPQLFRILASCLVRGALPVRHLPAASG
jgi:hypothetical protein